MHAQNQVLGEVQFVSKANVEKTSGVWIDGQYVGYVGELKEDKKVLLLPGEHEISVRQSGYMDFTQKVVAEPGKKVVLHVTMQKILEPNFPQSHLNSSSKSHRTGQLFSWTMVLWGPFMNLVGLDAECW